MRSPVLLFLFIAVLIGRVCAASPALLAGQRVLVLGDSITQDGRYVSFLEYYLHRLAPGARCDLVSAGLSSETLSGLSEPGLPAPRPNALHRLDRALALVKPTVVFACYGMNDGIYHPPAPERLAAFEAGLDQFITKVRAAGARIVLITPPVFDAGPIADQTVGADAPAFGYRSFYRAYNDVLAAFARSALARAAADVTVIDLNTAMLAALAAARAGQPDFTFSPDGIHPGETGHLLMARTVAAGLGLPVPDAPLAAELARIQADPLYPLVAERRALRAEAWLARIGYTHRETFRSPSTKAAEAVAARLQAEIERFAAGR